MLTTKQMKKILTKAQQKHLAEEGGIDSIAAFISNRKMQVKRREELLADGLPMGIAEPCLVCCRIARKLEIWVL